MIKDRKEIHINLGQNDTFYKQFKAVANMRDETITKAVRTAISLYLKKYGKTSIFSIDTNN